MMPDFMDDEEEESGEKVFSEEDKEIVLRALQRTATQKQGRRTKSMGELLRSKGSLTHMTSSEYGEKATEHCVNQFLNMFGVGD